MNLHLQKEEFNYLISVVAKYKKIPESFIERDYFIVLLLNNFVNSEYGHLCVFKGGTSLSKCYPGSIERFSEDIDLTFLGMDKSDNYCDKQIKKIEKIMTNGHFIEKINEERNKRNKSSYVWFSNRNTKIKLEIGSSVKPEPFSIKTIKSYIHEYLETHFPEYIEKYNLKEIKLNVLNIERTFIDKLLAIKRHAYCGTLSQKVRHIYDVIRLYEMENIKEFLNNKKDLKNIIRLTKNTDSYYLKKRKIAKDYNPLGVYGFDNFRIYFNDEIKKNYENLHKELLYTNKKQDFEYALTVLEKIDEIFKEIEE